MRILALEPSSAGLLLAVVEGGEDGSYAVTLSEEWKVGDDRLADLVDIRKRLADRLPAMKVDAVCVSPLEPMAIKGGRARMVLFEGAELRGVVAEVARSVYRSTEFRAAAKVSRTIGERKGSDYVSDDAFWAESFKTEPSKKYRKPVLMAVSYIREHS